MHLILSNNNLYFILQNTYGNTKGNYFMVTEISFILRAAFVKISGRCCYIAMAPPSYLFFIFISALLVNLVALVVNLLVNYSVQFNRSEMELQCRLTSQMLKSVY